jgi:hypothetical protein
VESRAGCGLSGTTKTMLTSHNKGYINQIPAWIL